MRLFIALCFEGGVLNGLRKTRDDLRRAGVRGNFTKDENLHLTLAFIGEYGDPGRALEAMKTVPFEPAAVELDGIGAFDGVWWAGVRIPDSLAAYVRRLRRALSDAGIPVDGKKFRPHVTLVRRPDRPTVPPVAAPRGGETVPGVSLMRSDRGKDGMIYTEIGFVK